ncbi:hypothetical protein PR048_024710 [Dryococelus australis]|uniref:Transposase Tc1-like domain-containing protein n=1 Tax=Dryococelus australis TaxID=614101 RepID=A0ABQ9GPC3_9NEOP|nr:hypothetical protein PR048_024710 [Dryococelus australis]
MSSVRHTYAPPDSLASEDVKNGTIHVGLRYENSNMTPLQRTHNAGNYHVLLNKSLDMAKMTSHRRELTHEVRLSFVQAYTSFLHMFCFACTSMHNENSINPHEHCALTMLPQYYPTHAQQFLNKMIVHASLQLLDSYNAKNYQQTEGAFHHTFPPLESDWRLAFASSAIEHNRAKRPRGGARPLLAGPRWCGGQTTRLHLGEPGSIPCGVALGFSHVRIVPEDAGRRVFSVIFHFPHLCVPALLHTSATQNESTRCAASAADVATTSNKVVSAHTVRNVLNSADIHGRSLRKKPYISEVNRKKRLAFTKEYCGKPLGFWDRIVFSDEDMNIVGSIYKLPGSKSSDLVTVEVNGAPLATWWHGIQPQ